jgi:hypothetical protein
MAPRLRSSKSVADKKMPKRGGGGETEKPVPTAIPAEELSMYEDFLDTYAYDVEMADELPMWMKVLFLCTNLPYWIIAIAALAHDNILNDAIHPHLEGICGLPAFYFVFALLIASSSTAMHFAQLNISTSCGCCTSRDEAQPRRNKFDRYLRKHRTQLNLQVMDVNCATASFLSCLLCRNWVDVLVPFAYGCPFFIGAILAKQRNNYYAYVVLHGIWHLLSASVVWHVVMPPLSSLVSDYVLLLVVSFSGLSDASGVYNASNSSVFDDCFGLC